MTPVTAATLAGGKPSSGKARSAGRGNAAREDEGRTWMQEVRLRPYTKAVAPGSSFDGASEVPGFRGTLKAGTGES